MTTSLDLVTAGLAGAVPRLAVAIPPPEAGLAADGEGPGKGGAGGTGGDPPCRPQTQAALSGPLIDQRVDEGEPCSWGGCTAPWGVVGK